MNEPPTDQNLVESMETTAEGMEVGGPTGESESMSQDEVCSNSEDTPLISCPRIRQCILGDSVTQTLHVRLIRHFFSSDHTPH